MRKNALSVLKISLIICTLVVLGLGAIPQSVEADPGDIDIYCDGTPNMCFTVEGCSGWCYEEYFLGNWYLIVIYT